MIHHRISRLFRAVVSENVTQLEADHAHAMLDAEREELRMRVGAFNQGLAGYAAICERLKRQLRDLALERNAVEARLRQTLGTGDRSHAGRLALRLEQLTATRTEAEQQLAETNGTYQELVRTRGATLTVARDKLDGLKRTIEDCRMQKALADLTETAASWQGQLGVSDSGIDRLEDALRDRRDLAAGRTRVARETIECEGHAPRAAEQAALAELALARFESDVACAPQPTATE